MENEDFNDIFGLTNFDLFDTSSSASSESDSDDLVKLINLTQPRRRQRIKRVRYDFSDLSDDVFEKKFRLPRTMVAQLVDRIKHKLEPPSFNNPISPTLQVLIALRYYATGTFQTVLEDLFGVSQKSISNCIRRVSTVIATLASDEAIFPKTREETVVMNHEFYKIAKMPMVIGVIDGTHIPIESPGGENAELFRNRKGYFSINTQVVVDATMKITDIVARWPGSNHDQSVFNFSQLKIRFENEEFGNSILLGDAGYSCKNYLLTPLSNPTSPAELRYQRAFIRTRLIVERTIGVWKKRFPVLSKKMLCNLETAVIIIVATSVLHNLLRHRAVPSVEDDLQQFYEEPETVASSESHDFRKRNEFIQKYFS